jgi:hypothetical protein
MDTPAWKQRCLLLADCFDAWRVLPRGALLAYCWFVYELTHELLHWYMGLPAAERSLEASGLAAAIFTAVTGFGAKIFADVLRNEKGAYHGDST